MPPITPSHRPQPGEPVCPPPATQTAASLPAPAAGQGEGTNQRRRRLPLAASLAAFISAFSRSRSRRLARFSVTTMAVQIALTATASAAAPQTIQITSANTDFIGSPWWSLVFLIVGCQVLSLALFWLFIVPAHDWLVDRLVSSFGRPETGE